MKAKFSSLPQRKVSIVHGEESVEITLRPLPSGYVDFIDRLLPKAVKFINGKEVEDEHKVNENLNHKFHLMIAKSMGDQLETQAPEGMGATSDVWITYAKAIKSELEASNFLEADLFLLISELGEVNKGRGTLGNA